VKEHLVNHISYIYNIYTWFVSSKHSHWLIVVHTILLWQIKECSLVGISAKFILVSGRLQESLRGCGV